MFISICYNPITYKTLIWFTLTPVTTLSPGLTFIFITFNTKLFFSIFYYFLRENIISKCNMIIREIGTV